MHVGDLILVPRYFLMKDSLSTRLGTFCGQGNPCLWEMMVSTSYSSSDLIKSGGGVEKLGPCVSVCLYGDRREAWKTL